MVIGCFVAVAYSHSMRVYVDNDAEAITVLEDLDFTIVNSNVCELEALGRTSRQTSQKLHSQPTFHCKLGLRLFNRSRRYIQGSHLLIVVGFIESKYVPKKGRRVNALTEKGYFVSVRTLTKRKPIIEEVPDVQ